MTTLRAASATDVGRVRSVNQDSLIVAEPLFAVADGMGGHAAGEVASRVAVETVKAVFAGDPTAEGLMAAAHQANSEVWQRGLDDPDLRGMGTTLTAAALIEADGEQRLAIVNVGDSRAYLLQQGELSQLTEDHSLVEEMVRRGEINASEAATHPRRHVITRAIGIEPEVEPDQWQILPYRGDRLLLCSDGLIDEVSDDEIAGVLRRELDTKTAAQQLVALARAHGGSDNITVVLVDVVDDDARAAKASAALASSPRRAGAAAASSPDATMQLPVTPAPAPSAPSELTEPDPAPNPQPAPAETSPAGPPAAAGGVGRWVTGRTVMFLVALLVVLGIGVGAVQYVATSSWFVGIDSGQVTVFRGRPGGLLWVRPRSVERTVLPAVAVPADRVMAVHAGVVEPSRAAAEQYVANLEAEAASFRTQ